MADFKYSPVDFLFTCVGLLFLLLDITLDVYAVVSFYQERAYVSLGVLLLFLLGSSVLVQVFSWLFYMSSYEDLKEDMDVGKRQLRLLHLFQLGIYFRHAGVVKVSLRGFFGGRSADEGFAVFLSHDLSFLRLIETFSESAPQLVLMLTIILQRGQLDPVTVLKAVGSASAIAVSVTLYHRSLRSFLPDKERQRVSSSLVYFLWNLLLVSSRLSALALFASVLPCFIFAHFLCSWLLFLVFACLSRTDLMDGGGEWLYRATVGLIWYFDWFGVAAGRTRYRTLLYHGFMLVDVLVLCCLWCWKMSTEQFYFQIPRFYAAITAAGVVSVYVLGLLFKLAYYRWWHPNLSRDELKGSPDDVVDTPVGLMANTEVDGMDRCVSRLEEADVKRCGPNKRMRKLAENFYS